MLIVNNLVKKSMDTTLIKKIEVFAATAHKGKTRALGNEPYINHPIRVMQRCSRVSSDEALLAAALLHDVLEKTTTTATSIRAFLNNLLLPEEVDRVLLLVSELTDVYTEQAFPEIDRGEREKLELERLKQISEAAQTIKYADIIDNSMDLLQTPTPDAYNRTVKYMAILEALNKGNATLYSEALKAVNELFEQLARNTAHSS